MKFICIGLLKLGCENTIKSASCQFLGKAFVFNDPVRDELPGNSCAKTRFWKR